MFQVYFSYCYSDFEDEESEKDDFLSVESDVHSGDSLPRQSVVRRTSTHMSKFDQSQKMAQSDSEYELSDNEKNELDWNGNEGSDYQSLSLRVSIPKEYSKGIAPESVMLSDSDESMDLESNKTGSVHETKLVCHPAGSFYKSAKTTGRCFYKDQESSDDQKEGLYSSSRRKAARKVNYTAFSDSEEGGDVGVASKGRGKRTHKQTYDSDSEFVVCSGVHVQLKCVTCFHGVWSKKIML